MLELVSRCWGYSNVGNNGPILVEVTSGMWESHSPLIHSENTVCIVGLTLC